MHLEKLDLTQGALRLHVRRRDEAAPAPRAETSLPAVVDIQVDPNALYSFRRDSFKHRDKAAG